MLLNFVQPNPGKIQFLNERCSFHQISSYFQNFNFIQFCLFQFSSGTDDGDVRAPIPQTRGILVEPYQGVFYIFSSGLFLIQIISERLNLF